MNDHGEAITMEELLNLVDIQRLYQRKAMMTVQATPKKGSDSPVPEKRPIIGRIADRNASERLRMARRRKQQKESDDEAWHPSLPLTSTSTPVSPSPVSTPSYSLSLSPTSSLSYSYSFSLGTPPPSPCKSEKQKLKELRYEGLIMEEEYRQRLSDLRRKEKDSKT